MTSGRFFALLILVIAGEVIGQTPTQRQSAAATPDVSIILLIANPSNYDGKYIRIKGVSYFDSRGSINAICLTRDDKRAANGANAIFLYFSPSIKEADKLNDKYVLAQGVFRAHDHGHLGSFAGSLDAVDRVEAIKFIIK